MPPLTKTLLGLLGIVATGCGTPALRISIPPVAQINQQRSLYVLVRAVEPKQYLSESYATVAAQVITPDATVLGSGVLFPGRAQELRVPISDAKPVAIYFLFAAPTGDWKVLQELPLPREMTFKLGQARIEQIERRGTLKLKAAGAPKLKAPKLKAPKLK